MAKASASAGWLQELAKFREYQDGTSRGHVPETEEYGISSVVFHRYDRPFHPGRLNTVLKGFGNYASSIAAASTAAAGNTRQKGKGKNGKKAAGKKQEALEGLASLALRRLFRNKAALIHKFWGC